MHHSFLFDGTNKGFSDGGVDRHNQIYGAPTNIALIWHWLDNALIDGTFVPVVAHYSPGVGDADNDDGWLERTTELALGTGVNEKVRRALDILDGSFRPGDSISVFGFSRGGGIASRFADIVCKEGVRGFYPGVLFLGCFDRVTGYGKLGNKLDAVLQIDHLFADRSVHPHVNLACHLVAKDERRVFFEPTLMQDGPNVYQEWITGDHSGVGGGYQNRKHSNYALKRMCAKAELMGLRFHSCINELPHDLDMPPQGPVPGYRLLQDRVPGRIDAKGNWRALRL